MKRFIISTFLKEFENKKTPTLYVLYKDKYYPITSYTIEQINENPNCFRCAFQKDKMATTGKFYQIFTKE